MPRDSAVVRSVHGDDVASWSLSVELLAAVVDVLAAANWQRSGGKGRRPRPIPRPRSRSAQKIRVRGRALSLDELDRRLGWASPRRRD